jgi:hypothetical protein
MRYSNTVEKAKKNSNGSIKNTRGAKLVEENKIEKE